MSSYTKAKEPATRRSDEKGRKIRGKSRRATARNFPSARLQERLLRWYDLNQRALPWRETSDSYQIWISEIMLQQTRVQAVVPYYLKFLTRFPDIESLAEAPEETLLACWSGLGYYSRARNLQKAAQVIVREYRGKFPRDLSSALSLPGIGRYTAAAVLSIAYGLPLAVLDGNVARVLSRLYALAADVKDTRGRDKLWALASELIEGARLRPGDWNQALMELGATVCVPKRPQCAVCPVQRCCLASERGEVELYPPARHHAKPRVRRFTATLITDGAGRLLMLRRDSSGGWLDGFWELPMWEDIAEGPRKGIALHERIGTVCHTITENKLRVTLFRGSIIGRGKLIGAKWIAPHELSDYPVTTITRKALTLPALVKTSKQ